MNFPENIKTNKDVLDTFCLTAPYLNHVIREDMAVAVTDTEKFLVYVPGHHVDVKMAAGDRGYICESLIRIVRNLHPVVARGSSGINGRGSASNTPACLVVHERDPTARAMKLEVP